MQLFRRLLLLRLHQTERLSESFMQNLLSWVHPGFSVYAGPPVEASELTSLESQARYITRPALAMDALHKLDDGSLALETPPDPRTAYGQNIYPFELFPKAFLRIGIFPSPEQVFPKYSGRLFDR
jgi:hypothetical protein